MATVGAKTGIGSRRAWRAALPAIALAACVGACDMSTPLEPVNRSPVARSLVAFPTTLGVGDSAIVVCEATDPNGDTLAFDWSSDCRLLMQGNDGGRPTLYSRGRSMVVYAGPCNRAPLDTGWVRCEVRDGRGGYTSAGLVPIVVRQ